MTSFLKVASSLTLSTPRRRLRMSKEPDLAIWTSNWISLSDLYEPETSEDELHELCIAPRSLSRALNLTTIRNVLVR